MVNSITNFSNICTPALDNNQLIDTFATQSGFYIQFKNEPVR